MNQPSSSDIFGDDFGKRLLKMTKIITMTRFLLDQHVPETKGQKTEDRILSLAHKILLLKMENAANSKALDALEKLYLKEPERKS